MASSTVYFIIVTYNGMQWIEKCIQSIYANRCNNIIVIDNNSQDGTVNYIKKNHPGIDLTALNENAGFGAANNIGIKKALALGSDYFFLLNQDAYLQENCLSHLLATMEDSPEAGIASPVHLNSDKTAFDRSFARYLTWMEDYAFLNDVYFGRLKTNYSVSFVNAAAWLLSRQCVEKVGFFDAIFFHYGEDDNYCQRVRFHGMKIIINTKASIIHDREDRKGEVQSRFKKQEFIRGKLIQFCNPFNQPESEMRRFFRSQKLEMAKAIIQLDFNRLQDVRKAYHFFWAKRTQIIESSRKNKEPLQSLRSTVGV